MILLGVFWFLWGCEDNGDQKTPKRGGGVPSSKKAEDAVPEGSAKFWFNLPTADAMDISNARYKKIESYWGHIRPDDEDCDGTDKKFGGEFEAESKVTFTIDKECSYLLDLALGVGDPPVDEEDEDSGEEDESSVEKSSASSKKSDDDDDDGDAPTKSKKSQKSSNAFHLADDREIHYYYPTGLIKVSDMKGRSIINLDLRFKAYKGKQPAENNGDDEVKQKESDDAEDSGEDEAAEESEDASEEELEGSQLARSSEDTSKTKNSAKIKTSGGQDSTVP